MNSQPDTGGEGLRTTGCDWQTLVSDGVAEVQFTVLALEPGEHKLTFKLETRKRQGDTVVKKLRVVVRFWTLVVGHQHQTLDLQMLIVIFFIDYNSAGWNQEGSV